MNNNEVKDKNKTKYAISKPCCKMISVLYKQKITLIEKKCKLKYGADNVPKKNNATDDKT